MKNIFVTGGSSGIGKAIVKLLSKKYYVYAPDINSFNLNNLEMIQSYNFENFDTVINCAAVNNGTYLGFENNSLQNQKEQVLINFIAPLIMFKSFVKTRPRGVFCYISSYSIEKPKAYNIFYASSKAALKHSLDCFKKEYLAFDIIEICPGKTKTNMLFNNYLGTRTHKECNAEYEQQPYLLPIEVAKKTLYALENNIERIYFE